MIQAIIKDLESVSNKEKAIQTAKYFKTGKGEYAEGDIFIGISMPHLRIIAKKFAEKINLIDLQKLVSSEIHEFRMTALIILTEKFTNDLREDKRRDIIDFYLSNTQYINNWDLVDVSCSKLLGAWLIDKDKDILFKLSKSSNLWEQRISIISCLYFIKQNETDVFLQLAKELLNHPHDLIHKAIGWLLREVGKIDIEKEKIFLRVNYKCIPRTMLRYAIERFPEDERQDFLKGRI